MQFIKLTAIATLALVSATSAFAQSNPRVGGAPMLATQNIVENAVNSKDHTTLVAAVTAAGLVETLQSAGPFTVFAPVNSGFAELPEGTVDTLLKPENKSALVKVLTAHVVPGKLSAADLLAGIAASSNGQFGLRTVSGDTLIATARGNAVFIYDESGNASRVTIADVNQSNGVIHVIDDVLLPK
jgi:uncharacterized surface protein with fasciclin (FAS1) repeats